jgi:hypothetical protein
MEIVVSKGTTRTSLGIIVKWGTTVSFVRNLGKQFIQFERYNQAP